MDTYFPGSLVGGRGSSAGAEGREAGISLISGQSTLQDLGSFPRQPRPTAVFLIPDRTPPHYPLSSFHGPSEGHGT